MERKFESQDFESQYFNKYGKMIYYLQLTSTDSISCSDVPMFAAQCKDSRVNFDDISTFKYWPYIFLTENWFTTNFQIQSHRLVGLCPISDASLGLKNPSSTRISIFSGVGSFSQATSEE